MPCQTGTIAIESKIGLDVIENSLGNPTLQKSYYNAC